VNAPVRTTPLIEQHASNQQLREQDPPTQHPDQRHEHRHAIFAAEASGLLLMAILLLILTLIRYWQSIAWSAR
jgi:hypothetical protein